MKTLVSASLSDESEHDLANLLYLEDHPSSIQIFYTLIINI